MCSSNLTQELISGSEASFPSSSRFSYLYCTPSLVATAGKYNILIFHSRQHLVEAHTGNDCTAAANYQIRRRGTFGVEGITI